MAASLDRRGCRTLLVAAMMAQAAGLVFAWPVYADELSPAKESFFSRIQTLSFGVAERFMFQSSYSGPNLSTLFSWNPELPLSDTWSATGLGGVTFLKGTDRSFPAFRVQVGVAYQRLHPRLVPEMQVGTEIWPRSGGGVYAATALNLHYRFRPDTGSWPHWAALAGGALDSLWLGYHTAFVPSNLAHQLVVGVRISFPPRPLPETKPIQAAAHESSPSPVPVVRTEKVLKGGE